MCFVSSTRSLSAGSTLGMLVQWSNMEILLPRFGDCGSRIGPLQMRSRTIGETVRRERRGTSVGAYPDASLFRLPRHQTVNTRDVWSPTPGRSSRALLVPRLSVLTREPSSVAFRGAFAAPQY
jgi:hypothetical protein